MKKERNTWLALGIVGALTFLFSLIVGIITGKSMQFLLAVLFAGATWNCARQFREKKAALEDALRETEP